VEGEVTADIVADLSALIDVADLLDLELRPPAGGNKWSADLMSKSASRPAVGVQGRILDAMDDKKINPMQAQALLFQVRRRLDGRGPGISIVDGNGNLRPINMEVVDGTRP
jgi:hypothetical protein